MREPVQQCRCHLGITKDTRPFREVQVRRDHHAGVLIQPAEQVEQQRTACLAERQVAQLIEDHQVQAQQARRDASGLALCLLLLQRVDQIHRGVKAHAPAMLGDAGHANGCGQVGLAGARPSHQHHVVRHFCEACLCQRVNQLAVNGGHSEVEPSQVSMHRELGCMHLMAHRAHASVCGLGLQQVPAVEDGRVYAAAVENGQATAYKGLRPFPFSNKLSS